MQAPATRRDRRQWFRSVAGAAFAVIASRIAPAQAAREPILVDLLDCAVAGFQYHAGEILWLGLAIDDELTLVREPDNPHDALAVAIHWQGQRIGYIPRLANRALARRLDAGLPTSATISALREHAPPWERIEVRVRAWV